VSLKRTAGLCRCVATAAPMNPLYQQYLPWREQPTLEFAPQQSQKLYPLRWESVTSQSEQYGGYLVGHLNGIRRWAVCR